MKSGPTKILVAKYPACARASTREFFRRHTRGGKACGQHQASPENRCIAISGFLLLALLLELLAEEVVEEGADHRDHRQTDQLLLARGYGGGQDVGGELELQRQDEPAAKAEADAREAGFMVPLAQGQQQGLAKADDHAGHRDEFESELDQLHAVQHRRFPLCKFQPGHGRNLWVQDR